MDFQALFMIAVYQMMSVRDAPLPVVVTAILVGLIVWRLAKWRYGAAVQSLKRAIVRRDAELEKLRAHGPQTADAPDVADDAGERTAAPSADHRRALRLVVNAIDQAGLALRSNDPREADRALSSMGLALQTVRRAFDLPVPSLGAGPEASLRTGKLFLERVRAPLRAGDADDARRVAAAFVAADHAPDPDRLAG